MNAKVTSEKSKNRNQPSEKILLLQSLHEHARMVERAQQAQQAGFLASIQALMGALEARDPYTCGHSERVRAWALRISRQLGFSESQFENIGLAARLHDIGKVGIRDAILEKSGPLSTEEWQIMRSHPVVGVNILAPIQILQSILPMIRGHHERWDGKGYPDGIQGESIPLGSRIIAVADAYDALVTNRPYRQAFTREKAREILRSGSGTQWDPEKVEVLLQIQVCSESRTSRPFEPVIQTRDPVCGMPVIPLYAPARTGYAGNLVYFCSTACRELFDQHPDQYQ